MMDSKVGPNYGKLTQLLDTLEVQNINMLIQITVHNSVRYIHSALQLLQQFCVQQTNTLRNLSISLMYLIMLTKKAPKHMVHS